MGLEIEKIVDQICTLFGKFVGVIVGVFVMASIKNLLLVNMSAKVGDPNR